MTKIYFIICFLFNMVVAADAITRSSYIWFLILFITGVLSLALAFKEKLNE